MYPHTDLEADINLPQKNLQNSNLGTAELCKTSWIVLYLLWPALWIAWTLLHAKDAEVCRRQAMQLAASLVLAVYVVNVGYGFEGSFRRLGDFAFVSETLAGNDAYKAGPGNRFEGSMLANLLVPFPENYIVGIDIQKAEFERGKWSYLRGEQKHGGWWYYYLYGCAVKIPIGTWLIGFLAVAATLRYRRMYSGIHDEYIVVAPAIVIFILVSSQTSFNRYLRYVVPAFPFLLIYISKVARSIEFAHRHITAIGALGLSASIVSSLSVYPHCLSYFNALAGGPRGGHAHLVDGNIDWGQDLLYLKRWIDAHPQATDMKVAYFGFIDCTTAGIEAEPPPPGVMAATSDNVDLAKLGPLPGWYAVSVNYVCGYRHMESDSPRYIYFLDCEPVAMAGYSIYVYHLTLDQANAVRCQSKLPPIGPTGEGCWARLHKHR